MTMLLLGMTIFVMIGFIGGLWRRNRRMYRAIDMMLDEILDDEKITESDICEGEISALAAKVKRVQEKVASSVSEAEKEREAVKQLISNLSHQVKTPLSVIGMYQEMLADESLGASPYLHTFWLTVDPNHQHQVTKFCLLLLFFP